MALGRMRQILNFTSPPNAKSVKTKFNASVVLDIIGDSRVKNLPILAICVAGNRRTGKSFLVNMMILFLEDLQKNAGRYSSYNWQQANPQVSGVDWKRSRDSITEGIWMWSRPYVIDDGRGQKICVLLLDCQGMGDSDTNDLTKDAIVTLCGLEMSKIHILNVKGDLDSSSLSQLEHCIMQANTEDTKQLFNALLMVHRDWLADDDLGIQPDYFTNRSQNHKLNRKENLVRDVFQKCLACMIPMPGTTILRGSVDQGVHLQDLRKERRTDKFIKYITELLEKIFVTLAADSKFWMKPEEFKQVVKRQQSYVEGREMETFSSAAEVMERRQIFKAYDILEVEKFPEYESGVNPETYDTERELEDAVSRFKSSAKAHLSARKRRMQVKTNAAEKAWSQVEEKVDNWFATLKQRKLRDFRDAQRQFEDLRRQVQLAWERHRLQRQRAEQDAQLVIGAVQLGLRLAGLFFM